MDNDLIDAIAKQNSEHLDQLLSEVKSGSEDIQTMLGDLIDQDELIASDEPRRPPTTSDALKKEARQFLKKIDVRMANVKQSTFVKLTNVKKLGLPTPGQQLRIRTQKQLNLISLVMRIVEHHGSIDELLIATYTLNREAFAVLLDLVEHGRVGKLSLFLASSYTFRDPAYYEYLKSTVLVLPPSVPIHLAFAWLHLKITLARCGKDFCLFEGSMNYSMNNMAEQLLLENNQASFEHDRAFMAEILKSGQAAVEVVRC